VEISVEFKVTASVVRFEEVLYKLFSKRLIMTADPAAPSISINGNRYVGKIECNGRTSLLCAQDRI
jgi:hypothetical protein